YDDQGGYTLETSLAQLAKLPPAFEKDGSVTAGNAPGLNDGAAALVVTSRAEAARQGLQPLARIVGFTHAAVEPQWIFAAPAQAIPRLLKRLDWSLDDVDLIELNEAFAAQALAVIRELGLDEEKVNVNGGAIALGHPLGCTGAKLTVQIMNEMRRRDSQFGMVTMCIGGGMGAAGIFERLN
ncbi:MAG: thiolase family protein, partial [Anaerolineales bacterium]|nr:thiolase family protein [Anaerolineales bacterium]